MMRLWIVALFVIGLIGCGELGLTSENDDESGLPTAEELRARLAALELETSFTIVHEGGIAKLQTAVVARNTGDKPVRGLTNGAWAWWLRAYETPERNQGAIWRLEESLGGIPDIGRPFEVPAGDSTRFGPDWFPLIPISEILQDRPPGTYYFAAELDFSEPKLRTAEFFLGAARLADAGTSRAASVRDAGGLSEDPS